MGVKWWWLSWWYEGGSGDGVDGDVVVEGDGGDERVFVEMVLVTNGGDDVDCGVDGVVTDGVMMAAAGVVFVGGWPDSGDGAGFNERRGRSEDHE
ncbi:hypothetical protein Tco_1565225 [Tanacetum coccineum]